MKRLLFVLLLVLALGFRSNATNPPDEGMWLPIFVERLNYVDMQKMGLQLTAEEIYSINNSSIKDAIVGLSRGSTPGGYFCTAEVVSDEGLIFTNHHCGYGYIQKHSTIEHDYLSDGFWALSKEEELPNEGMSASFFVRMANVTDSIIPFLSDTLSETGRGGKVKEISKRLKERESEDGKYHVTVKSFFGGNEYYLFVYEVFTDVRLVGAPPSSIGKYGGDTDNWMWPRHTGDFSIFRIYTAPDGSAANFAEENVPLKPKHHLPIYIGGKEKGDFSMIWGYPGGTERYLTSYGIQFKLDNFYPYLIQIFGAKLDIWWEAMDADKEVKIQYASKAAGTSNAWKLFIGMDRGLRRLDVYGKKQKIEEKFQQWADANDKRKEKYGDVLSGYKKAYEDIAVDYPKLIITALAASRGSEILPYAQQFGQLKGMLEEKADPAIYEETITELREGAADHFKNYYAPADQRVMASLFEIYYEDVPRDFIPEAFIDMLDKQKGDFDALAAYVFENSIFSSEAKVNEFLDKPKFKTLDKDPAIILASAFQGPMAEAGMAYRSLQTEMNKNDRLFIGGLREMNPDKVYYPDANSTMRLSYGSVEDYFPADAVHYDFITTLNGVMEKEDPDNDEFIVEDKLKELYKKQDFGPYGQTINGKKEMITCFLSTNDITGGNSGSPVINGSGELIGIAFDGNWEAMSGDIAFEPDLQRTICVDIRYVLFIIDKFANAQNIIDELSIHKARPKAKGIDNPNIDVVSVSEEVDEPVKE
ncbi:MAG: S46 family peptidase [Bacteroidota bacterium]|nr:S46 family peptidase [Bacteroidota bacterium]